MGPNSQSAWSVRSWESMGSQAARSLTSIPIDNRLFDASRFAELGDAEVKLLISDSVNVERKGWSPSERSLVPVFDRFMRECMGRVIVATFGSNLHRVQTVFNVAERYGRKVAIFRSEERRVRERV